VRFGVSLPNVGDCGSPQTLVELGQEAEAAGWDGVFVWDCIHIEIAERDQLPVADPWIALAAIASATSRVRFGPFVTPWLAGGRGRSPARRSPSITCLRAG
jgi:alkanesulfonate monooxygenase SsuD/methylene tetrahydromethanopterin reductase-like flavin-dependent oxidoreductase (luciferase family)